MSDATDATDVYVIEPYNKFWAVYERPDVLLVEEALSGPPQNKLVTVWVYNKRAEEVKRRLTSRVELRTRHIFWRPCCQETREEADALNEGVETEPQEAD